MSDIHLPYLYLYIRKFFIKLIKITFHINQKSIKKLINLGICEALTAYFQILNYYIDRNLFHIVKCINFFHIFYDILSEIYSCLQREIMQI